MQFRYKIKSKIRSDYFEGYITEYSVTIQEYSESKKRWKRFAYNKSLYNVLSTVCETKNVYMLKNTIDMANDEKIHQMCFGIENFDSMEQIMKIYIIEELKRQNRNLAKKKTLNEQRDFLNSFATGKWNTIKVDLEDEQDA